MDPTGLSTSEWSDIGRLLTYLWIVVALVASFSINMLIGHVFIPSLVSSFHLPGFLDKIRPAFYTLAVISLGVAVLVFVQALGLFGVLERIWDDYWI